MEGRKDGGRQKERETDSERDVGIYRIKKGKRQMDGCIRGLTNI